MQYSWPDVILASDSMRERFSDVHIITLQAHFLEIVQEQAINQLMSLHGRWDERALQHIIDNIIKFTPPQVCEHVNVTLSKITVVIDVPEITDDTVWAAMDMLGTALQQLDGTQGIVPTTSRTISVKSTETI